jgi:hypothetical protein
VDSLAAVLADVLPEAAWERQLVAAVRAPPERRAYEVNEQLRDIDQTLSEWARVPRVCASICASSGLLLASLSLRGALSEAGEAPDGEALRNAVFRAIDPVALGILGAVFCLAVHAHASRAARARRDDTDTLVDRLEALVADPGAPSAVPLPRSLQQEPPRVA